jgi:hypothetical protein
MGNAQPRRDVPVHVTDIVMELVFAQIGQVQALAAKRATMVALQQALQPARDLQVEAAQDGFRRLQRHGSPALSQAQARCA